MFLVLSDRTVDLSARWVRTDEGTVDLTPREAELLACLLDHAGQTVSRDTLLAQVWGMTRPVVTRCVDTAVRRLRIKLEPEPSSPRHLVSVPGEGYRLQIERPATSGRSPARKRIPATSRKALSVRSAMKPTETSSRRSSSASPPCPKSRCRGPQKRP